ncbi:MAG: capsular polysaccharide biosynthesis protein [Thiotrichales bacterium]
MTFSRKLSKISRLEELVEDSVIYRPRFLPFHSAEGVLGWGLKNSSDFARRHALQKDLPYVAVEDGFLRSYGLGIDQQPPLSLILSGLGVYYDATRSTDMERAINNAAGDVKLERQGQRVIDVVRAAGLSKYNTGGPLNLPTQKNGQRRVLVVDQTAGDVSIEKGLASPEQFPKMLTAAIDENPGCEIWLKVHPDVIAGKKRSCFELDSLPDNVRILDGAYDTDSVLQNFSHIYVVTSQMGFDALLRGKRVSCFGMPFYAGWGLTDDRLVCERRTARVSLNTLAAVVFLLLPRYRSLDAGVPGDFFSTADFIARQKSMVTFWHAISNTSHEENTENIGWSGRVFCFGFRFWKHEHVRPFFGQGIKLHFVRTTKQAEALGINSSDRIAVWGQKGRERAAALAATFDIPIVTVEDGFIRSVGLGSDFIPPMSLVFDSEGIYFDPGRRSHLETMLSSAEFDKRLLTRARAVRERICSQNITKYNIGRSIRLQRPTGFQTIIFVPGQVEDDASIRKGADTIRTNHQLLEAVRHDNPSAYIIYKPHPDVAARNRKGTLHFSHTGQLCNEVAETGDVLSYIQLADEVHTITSLSGFDALMRHKKVVVYGRPFYAGWGLTEDKLTFDNRERRLNLDQLIAASLLLYPRYWDKRVGGFVECETILDRICEQRSRKHYRFVFSGLGRLLRRWWSFFCSMIRFLTPQFT